MNSKKIDLLLLFSFSLLLRISFSFYFQKYYFGELTFKYADTSSYLEPILNLINNGEYIGDKYLTDSRYFRPPVYPFFLGFFHLIFPNEFFDYIIAAVQCILGALTVVLAYSSIINITKDKQISRITGLILACYPFSILWTPILYTETIQLFLIFNLIYIVTSKNFKTVSITLQGALVGLIVLTKQYLGLIILLPLINIIFTKTIAKNIKIKYLFIIMISFTLTLSPWIIRNYVISDNFFIFFSKTAGLRFALDDMVAFTHFTNKFDENITSHVDSVANTGKISLQAHAEFVNKYRNDIDSASLLAFQCGGSFMEWRKKTSLNEPPYENCNDKVVLKFNDLSEKFWNEVPFWEALKSRRDSLIKIIIKSDLVNKSLNINEFKNIKYFLFKIRVLLLIFGMFGILYIIFYKNLDYENKLSIIAIFSVAIIFYLFFCLIMVQAEVRYLLTPDLLLTIFAGIIPALILKNHKLN